MYFIAQTAWSGNFVRTNFRVDNYYKFWLDLDSIDSKRCMHFDFFQLISYDQQKIHAISYRFLSVTILWWREIKNESFIEGTLTSTLSLSYYIQDSTWENTIVTFILKTWMLIIVQMYLTKQRLIYPDQFDFGFYYYWISHPLFVPAFYCLIF